MFLSVSVSVSDSVSVLVGWMEWLIAESVLARSVTGFSQQRAQRANHRMRVSHKMRRNVMVAFSCVTQNVSQFNQ